MSENPYQSPLSQPEPPPSRHRSFRLTPPPYMKGKRVKPRLVLIANVSQLAGVAAMFLSAFLVPYELLSIRDPSPSVVMLLVALVFGSLCAVFCLTLLGSLTLFRLVGLMTQEEARHFPYRRYHDSWLEPIDYAKTDRETR